MGLRDLNLLPVYASDENDLLKEFFVPTLSVARQYDRGVGYFNSGMLSAAGKGISALVENGGSMRLVFNGEVDYDDFVAIEKGYKARQVLDRIGEEFAAYIDDLTNYIARNRLQALSWLVGVGKLELKVALRPHGIYHEKVGIIYDASGDYVVFQGSVNETAAAVCPDLNFESFNVYCSWLPSDGRHIQPHKDKFERLWNNRSRMTVVKPFPEAAKEKLIQVSVGMRSPKVATELDLCVREKVERERTYNAAGIPTLPQTMGGAEYELRHHQKDALYSWKNHGFRGIFKLATGAGKTITAIHGAVSLYKHRKRLFVVVSVPYQSLADQWVEVLSHYDISAIRCYRSRTLWAAGLAELVNAFRIGGVGFGCAVVVNRTLESEEFQRQVARLPPEDFLFIGDECHHYSPKKAAKALPTNANMRIGLSATPEEFGGQISAQLSGFFGDVVAEYDLAQALHERVLTPYRYHVEPVYLDGDELEAYIDISRQIAAEYARQEGEKAVDWSPRLKSLMARRGRILAHCRAKLEALERVLGEQRPIKHTIFYCGEGAVEGEGDLGVELTHTEEVAQLAHSHGWKVSRFTSYESTPERKQILRDFREGAVDALVAIRCLDEGIDIPACASAYLLASSRNPRQFIQRRGRILRRSAGKKSADIFDFLVMLPQGVDGNVEIERRLFEAELRRFSEFAQLAINWVEAHKRVSKLAREYDLEHLL